MNKQELLSLLQRELEEKEMPYPIEYQSLRRAWLGKVKESKLLQESNDNLKKLITKLDEHVLTLTDLSEVLQKENKTLKEENKALVEELEKFRYYIDNVIEGE